MPKILFVHNGSSGRFNSLGAALMQQGHSCALINPQAGSEIPGVPTLRWQHTRPATQGVFKPAAQMEVDFLRGRAAADCAAQLKASGFHPDLILGHPGWGEMLFLAEVFPGVPQIQLGEFYFRTQGDLFAFDPEFQQSPSLDAQVLFHSRNAGLALSYTEARHIVAPTQFQASVLPEIFHPRTKVIHEGIDTDAVRRQPQPRVTLKKSGQVLDPTVPVITFINRHFEAARGFPTFMRALPRLLAASPHAHVFLIGSGERGGYGPQPAGVTWKQFMLKEVGDQLDLNRVHFTGSIPHRDLMTLLSLSRAHVYLTYPYVLSWSLLDAMACECLIIGSDTPPVREVVKHGSNGLLVNFFDHQGLADTLIQACAAPEKYTDIRRAARATAVNDFDRKRKCEPEWLALVSQFLL